MISQLPTDPIFEVQRQYVNDTRPDKFNAALGVLLQNQSPFLFSHGNVSSVVKNSYLPMQGDLGFLRESAQYYLGDLFDESTHVLQQTAGGTQAVWLLNTIAKIYDVAQFLVPIPTWDNYFSLLSKDCSTFNHLLPSGGVDVEAYYQAIKNAPAGSILMLQATKAHNPTGKGLSEKDRDQIIDAANKKNIWIYLDAAYLGLSEGVKKDVEWIRTCWKKSNRVIMGVSFSKTMTLYGHRTAAFMMKTKNDLEKKAVESHLQSALRSSISVPPRYGSDVAQHVFTQGVSDWETQLDVFSTQLRDARLKMRTIVTEYDNSMLLQQALDGYGLFALLPVSEAKIKMLREEHAIYIANNGRINVSGFIGNEEKIRLFLNE